MVSRVYIDTSIVGGYFDDMFSTLNKADILTSWNFRHIVNLEKIKGYNGVNLKCGYSVIEIRSPKELIKYENK